MLLGFLHEALKFGVGAEPVPVFIALNPWVIVITDLQSAPEPAEGLLFLA